MQTIDSLQFCRRGQSLTGEIPCQALPRLGQEIMAKTGVVRFVLQGGYQGRRACLTLQVVAELVVPCQRCGQGMPVQVQSESRMLVARSEAELEAWEDEHVLLDALVADESLLVADLVEDEVILSLPLSLRHPEGECAVQVPDGRVQDSD